jgi:hypothetical protein
MCSKAGRYRDLHLTNRKQYEAGNDFTLKNFIIYTFSPNIFKAIKCKQIGFAEHVVILEER